MFANDAQLTGEYDGLIWDIKEIKFYSDLGCNNEINRNGTPLDSYHRDMDEYHPRQAFTTNDKIWGGRADPDGITWIGMEFPSPRTIRCIRVQNHAQNSASQFWIQAKNDDEIGWFDVGTASDVSTTGLQWNDIPITDIMTIEPWNNCQDFFSCKNGELQYFGFGVSTRSCPSGTLFDVDLKKCMPEADVDNCPLDCISTIVSRTWRLVTSPNEIPDSVNNWNVEEIQFFNDDDCSIEISREDGEPISSGWYNEGHPRNAFKSSGTWDGKTNTGGQFFIGMKWPEPKEIRCIKVQNFRHRATKQIRIEAKNDEGKYVKVKNEKNLSTARYDWNSIQLLLP